MCARDLTTPDLDHAMVVSQAVPGTLKCGAVQNMQAGRSMQHAASAWPPDDQCGVLGPSHFTACAVVLHLLLLLLMWRTLPVSQK